MAALDNDRFSHLNFGGFDSNDFMIGRTPGNGASGFTLTDDTMKKILLHKQESADRKGRPNDEPSSLTGTLIDAATGAGASVIEEIGQPHQETTGRRRLGDIINVRYGERIQVQGEPAPSKPIVGLVELTKATAAPGIKPATPGTAIDPAAPFPGLVDDVSREARENRAYDLLFGENAFTRFSAGIGYGPFTPQEAMALRFFAARHSEELQQLRDLHGEGALRIAARAIIDVLQGNAGQILPQQHIIDAHFNAALNLALHPDYLHQEFERASRVEMFGQIYDYFEDQFYRNPSLSSNARAAFIESVTYEIEFFIDVAKAVPYADRPALMEVISEVLGEQGHGPVDQRAFNENLKAAISLFLARRAASQTPIVPILQQDAQELFRQANEQARRILEAANQPFADRTATIREAIEQAAANGDVYLQMALMDLLPPELGDALVPSSVVDPATSTALLNHLRNMRAPEAEAVLVELEANPGNVAPEILDALREAVDPRSALSSETKLKYDNYIANGTFSEEQYRKLKRLNPDRSPEEIINFLALLSQGIPLPGYVTREPEPAPPPGETTFGPVGRASQEELEALRERLSAESAATIDDVENGNSALSPEEKERAVDRATIQGMVAMLIMIDPEAIRVLRDQQGSIVGVAAVGIRSESSFHDREPALYIQDLLRVGPIPGVSLPLLQALYREAEALNLPLAARPLNNRLAMHYESLGGELTENGEVIWREMPRPVGQ